MEPKRSIAVIGLGYVGLPVAVAFAAAGFPTLGFDIDPGRIGEVGAGCDRTGEVDGETLAGLSTLRLTCTPDDLRAADFFIVTVPTPITAARVPDLGALLAASRTVGGVLKRGDVVVFESTVFPGATEEVCVPVLEGASGLIAGRDFAVGYSPERINPGDREHRLETVIKVVAGQDDRTLEIVADTYAAIALAGIHRAPSIRVAEAAKVIENVQRDVNIALMNELSLIFSRLGIDTHDVLAAAGTKWNFLPFSPGLVGGHCIGVDPYYLTHKAQEVGHHPELVLAGRRINDGMAGHVVGECVRRLLRRGRAQPTVTVLGVTFKEDIPDIRNSRAADVVTGLRDVGIDVQVADPAADGAAVRRTYGFDLTAARELRPADAGGARRPPRDHAGAGLGRHPSPAAGCGRRRARRARRARPDGRPGGHRALAPLRRRPVRSALARGKPAQPARRIAGPASQRHRQEDEEGEPRPHPALHELAGEDRDDAGIVEDEQHADQDAAQAHQDREDAEDHGGAPGDRRRAPWDEGGSRTLAQADERGSAKIGLASAGMGSRRDAAPPGLCRCTPRRKPFRAVPGGLALPKNRRAIRGDREDFHAFTRSRSGPGRSDPALGAGSGGRRRGLRREALRAVQGLPQLREERRRP